jgi:hypothetical protein
VNGQKEGGSRRDELHIEICNHLNDFFFLNLRDMFLREEEGQEIS